VDTSARLHLVTGEYLRAPAIKYFTDVSFWRGSLCIPLRPSAYIEYLRLFVFRNANKENAYLYIEF
jgi:hypothetical protein